MRRRKAAGGDGAVVNENPDDAAEGVIGSGRGPWSCHAQLGGVDKTAAGLCFSAAACPCWSTEDLINPAQLAGLSCQQKPWTECFSYLNAAGESREQRSVDGGTLGGRSRHENRVFLIGQDTK